MRGQVLIALFHGVSVMIVLFVLRVPLAAALGVLIFLGSFVPLIGLTVTGALCVAVALLEHGVTAGDRGRRSRSSCSSSSRRTCCSR